MGNNIRQPSLKNLGVASSSGCPTMRLARNRWNYTLPMIEETIKFSLFWAHCWSVYKVEASKFGQCFKKHSFVYLVKYLYSFQGDSWYNFLVFCRFPVLASTHFWRCVHWKHRPVLRMMGSCFHKHKKPGVKTRRRSDCNTCNFCLCMDQGLELLKDRKND